MGNNRQSLIVPLMVSSVMASSFAMGQSVEACRQERSDSLRLACYDALFDSPAIVADAVSTTSGMAATSDPANATPAPQVVMPASSTSTLDDAPIASASEVTRSDAEAALLASEPSPTSTSVLTSTSAAAGEGAAQVDTEVAARAQEAYDEVIANAQTLVVTDVRRNSRRQVFFATEQGRTFRRESGSYASFKEGDQLSIESGMMSSMFLVNQDGLRIKVKEL
ncbi:hypothetical protein DFR27_1905 [Umboniibacter marinipuniceus]|uniref:Type IV pilus biogenesis protein PilP n=2 Tax=Umboniibacter marinipuniceus TaxID=569599 RepID=A0A3M0A503_9GAMM|nr:hypothetical protein DFR27_1905 [Umboniibacter marinipuniceus]